MPMNGYTIGKDVSIDIVTPSGPLRLKVKTGFTKKQDTTEQKVKRLDGMTDNLVFPDGWSGTVDVERQDSTLDDFFANLEANYFLGLDTPTSTITETTREPDGSVTQFRFVNVMFKYSDAGNATGDKTVSQKLDFMASRRLKIA